MHFSITGDLGSGKSTVAKEICKRLNFKYLSTGQIQRQLALEKGMNTLEFNKFTDDNKEIDDYIDQRLKDINDQTEPYVLDSRLGWHFVKKSFKIYLMAIEEVAASRVLDDAKRIGEPVAQDIKAKIAEQQERRKSENDRFEKNYGVKPSIFSDFDAIIDSSSASIEEVTDLIVDLYTKHQNAVSYNKIWLSPLRIMPTLPVEAIEDEIAVTNDISALNCVLYKKEFYLYNGHKLFSNNLQHKSPFIPVRLLAKNSEVISEGLSVETFVSSTFDIDRLKDWERKYDFNYFHYPTI
jgi:CMP/dCMP kinase